MIPSLLERLKMDPDCVVDWNFMEDSLPFECAFICPSMTRNALKYYQPRFVLMLAIQRTASIPLN